MTTKMLLIRSIGMMRNAPKNGLPSPKLAGTADCAAPGALAAKVEDCCEAASPAPLPPLTNLSAASTSLVLAYLRGNTPTDMPLSKSTSKVLTSSIQPSACVRVPIMTKRLRTVSTRTKASAETIGRRIDAISPAPMYCNGMMTAP